MRIKEEIKEELLLPKTYILYRERSDKEFGIKICKGCDTSIKEIATKVKREDTQGYLLCRSCLSEIR